MEKVLVTGGSGFIGSHLVKALVEKEVKVLVLDNLCRGNKLDRDLLKNVELIVGDIRDKELLKNVSKGCDAIFHFAALLGVDIVADNPVETMDVEVIGMKSVTDAAIYNGVEKVIYASTSGVYGHSAITKGVTENIQLDPRTSYAISKRLNEIYLAAQYEEKYLESISLRFFNVYGTKQDERMVIPRFFKQAMNNKPITVFGDGKQTRDFTRVEDTIYAAIRLAEKVNGCEIFNIANEKEITIYELAKLITDITNSSSEIKLINPPARRYDFEVERRYGNSEKLYNAIHYKPNTKIEEGLKKVYQYLLHNSR